MNYDKGFKELKELFKDTNYESEILILEQRFRDNEHEIHLFGEDNEAKVRRNKLIYRLNQISKLNYRSGENPRSFNDMCR